VALSWVGCGEGTHLEVSESINENAMWWWYSFYPDHLKLESYAAQGTECFGTSSFFGDDAKMTTDFTGAVSMTMDEVISIYDFDYRQPW